MRSFLVVQSVLIILLMSGCAIVEIQSDGAPPQTQLHFGVLSIDVPDNSSILSSTTSAIGLYQVNGETTLGFQSNKVVKIYKDCQAVFFVENQKQFEAGKRLVGEARDLCIVK